MSTVVDINILWTLSRAESENDFFLFLFPYDTQEIRLEKINQSRTSLPYQLIQEILGKYLFWSIIALLHFHSYAICILILPNQLEKGNPTQTAMSIISILLDRRILHTAIPTYHNYTDLSHAAIHHAISIPIFRWNIFHTSFIKYHFNTFIPSNPYHSIPSRINHNHR